MIEIACVKHAAWDCHFWGIFMSNEGTNFYAWKLERDKVIFTIPSGTKAVDDVRLLVTWKEDRTKDLKAIVSFKAEGEQKWAQIEFEKGDISFQAAEDCFRFTRALPEEKGKSEKGEYRVDLFLSHDDKDALKTLLRSN